MLRARLQTAASPIGGYVLKNLRSGICFAVTLIALLMLKPGLPVWMGAGLIMLAVAIGRSDLRSCSASSRWRGFKRAVFVSIAGLFLVWLGFRTGGAPWQMTAASPEEARHAMFALLVYSLSLIGAPAIAWAYISHREPVIRRKVRNARTTRSLSRVAHQTRTRRLRAAI